MTRILTLILAGAMFASAQAPAGSVTGSLTVNGKVAKFTKVYAYSAEGFFDKKRDDTVVLLTDRTVTDAQIRDGFALRRMAGDGKLAFVQATINAAGQIINFTIGHQGFKAPPSGGSTEHVFVGKQEGRTIEGKVSTNGEQEFFGTKYEYSSSFKVAVLAKK